MKKKYLGQIMLATPFIIVGIGSALILGVLPTLLIFGLTAITIVWTSIGSYLVKSGEEKKDDD
jgi:hypothetical protein